MSTPGTHELGPQHGTVRVHTFREGAAQKIGHDLVIGVERWDATATIGDDGALSAVTLNVDSTSLKVLEGLHGIKALSDKDRRDIAGTIAGKILGGTPIVFASDAVEVSGETATVSGGLTLAEATRPASFTVAITAEGRITGTLTVTQTEWGVKPYKTMMGALRVRDDVEIVLDIRLPGG